MNTKTADSQRRLLLAYSFLPFIRPQHLTRLIEHFGTLDSISTLPAEEIAGIAGLDVQQAHLISDPYRLPKIRRQVEQCSESYLTLFDAQYPEALKAIPDPPFVLRYRGNLEVLARPLIALVGSRRASAYGVNVTVSLTRALCRDGVGIISGLARGIDTAAHEEALAGEGATIAVLGTGIDRAYPRRNEALQQRIEQEGLVLSEFPEGAAPLAHHFPIRNRIISGLALGVVVIEAADRSGSLITARLAAEQGREVFAVPGSVFSAGSAGGHRLIQDGAKLVHGVENIYEEIRELASRRPNQVARQPPEEEALRGLWQRIPSDEPLHPDFLLIPGEGTTALANHLLQLELGGWVRRVPGAGYVRNV